MVHTDVNGASKSTLEIILTSFEGHELMTAFGGLIVIPTANELSLNMVACVPPSHAPRSPPRDMGGGPYSTLYYYFVDDFIERIKIFSL